MYSHHSHSGSYSQHGVDTIDEMVSHAEQKKFRLFCLTEHVPRINAKYLYPEEIHFPDNTSKDLKRLEDDFAMFIQHANKIRQRYKNESSMKIIVGTEIESCDIEQIRYCRELMKRYSTLIRFCIGSVHHVNGIPIDFDQINWNIAVKHCQNSLRQFIKDYYEQQYKMLVQLKPMVVGHFDLYKLFMKKDMKFDLVSGQIIDEQCNKLQVNNELIATPAETSVINIWEDVRKLVIRNLKFIGSYGGLIEINTSGLRKKLPQPYPGEDICQLAIKYCSGRFVLSDDSHSIEQIGTCYQEAMEYVTNVLKLKHMYYLKEMEDGNLQAIAYDI